jgi:Ca2+-transporting ATPase
MDKNWYSISIENVFKELKSNKNGLSDEEVKKRLRKFGLNELKESKKITPLEIFLRQFTSFIVIILLAAIVISAGIAYFEGGSYIEAIAILIIVILNGIFGFIQEYKAEKSIEALRKLTALKARVIRDGKEVEVYSRELVPGDIILLETGDKVPADSRLIEVAKLKVDESSLTGESIPVSKDLSILKKEVPIAERKNMVFMSTIITRGRAKAVVVETGMNTEIGKIATMVQDVGEKLTPLQVKLKEFGRWLGFVTIGICMVVFLVGILREFLVKGSIESGFVIMMFMAAISLAVAAIPEGLPAIVTISLALGVQRMVKRHALIRKLPAVETLGCTNVICSDKTGTLTKNEMTVREIFVNNEIIEVTGSGYKPEGRFISSNRKEVDVKDIELLLRISVLCNDAKLVHNEKWEIRGDPTEGALVVLAKKADLVKEDLEKKYPRIDEIPFESERKLMTTIHDVDGEKIAYVKGAPDTILDKCTHKYNKGKITKLTEKDKEKILKVNKAMAGKALRVLGMAYKKVKNSVGEKEIENNLIFVGLVGMIDPPRDEVLTSIKKCEEAGIKTVMITGDHLLTAKAIAKQLGLFKEGDMALTGLELDELNDDEFEKVVEKVKIYARVSPEHKVRILDALKKKGHIVAMTGDGVNDAPALKKSDIGIGMGITGTDVSREASDMVLTDDNFASIVNAVEEGRGIYLSIKRFIQYTLSSNFGEILVIFIGILFGFPLPLIAIQILWVNLVTDGLPGLALGLDPAELGLMRRPPRNPKEKIISRDVLENIFIVGIVMCLGTLFIFWHYGAEIGMNLDDLMNNAPKAQPMAFTTLVMFQLFNALTYRTRTFKRIIIENKWLVFAIISSVILQLMIIYTPLASVFKMVPLDLFDWLKIILISSALFFILEVRKLKLKK